MCRVDLIARTIRPPQHDIVIKIYAHKVHSRDMPDGADNQFFRVISPLVPIPGAHLHLPALGNPSHPVSCTVHD